MCLPIFSIPIENLKTKLVDLPMTVVNTSVLFSIVVQTNIIFQSLHLNLHQYPCPHLFLTLLFPRILLKTPRIVERLFCFNIFCFIGVFILLLTELFACSIWGSLLWKFLVVMFCLCQLIEITRFFFYSDRFTDRHLFSRKFFSVFYFVKIFSFHANLNLMWMRITK